VTLTQVGTSVNVDVVLNPGIRFRESVNGGNELFLFNDSLPGSTIVNIASAPNTPAGGIVGFTNLVPAVSAVGGGDFTASVECMITSECDGASTPDMTELTFTVTEATKADLETPNADGNAFFADTLALAAVPEPPTWAMMLVGFAGLAFAGRRARSGSINPSR
jgi:hypothetical protein